MAGGSVKNKNFTVLVKADGTARWQLTGQAALASQFPVSGDSDDVATAIEVAKESVRGAFARLNRMRKEKGIPLIHGKKKKPSPPVVQPSFNF